MRSTIAPAAEKLPDFIYRDANGEFRSLKEDPRSDHSAEPWPWPTKFHVGEHAYPVASVCNGSPERICIVRITKSESGCVPLYHVNPEGRNPAITMSAYTAEQLLEETKVALGARLPARENFRSDA